MNIEHIFLNAIYVPVVVMAGLAVWRFGSSLTRIVFRGEFDPDKHLLWAALVLLLAADVGENILYGTGRISRELYNRVGFSPAMVMPFKVMILAGALTAAAAWCRIVYQSAAWREAVLAAVVLWVLTACVLYYLS